MQRIIDRFGPLAGAASFLLSFVVWIAVTGGIPPEVGTSSAGEVVGFWTDQGDATTAISGLTAVFGAILILVFGAWLSTTMRDRGATALAATAGMGTLMIAMGLVIDGTIGFILGDEAASLPVESVLALSAMTEYLFLPYLLGLVLIMVSVGASATQTGLVPSWLARAGYVAAIVALIPHEVAFVGIMLAMLWMLVAGIVMFRGAGTSAPA